MRPRLPEERQHELRRLHWIGATLLLSVMPHMGHLPTWVLASLAAFSAWRYGFTRFGWRAMPRLPLLFVAFLHVLGVLFTYRTLNGVDAGSALMVSMIAMKLMETDRRRDFVLLIFLCYFLVASAFLYTQSIPVALLMIPTLFAITTALLEVTRPEGRAMSMVAAARQSGKLLAQALPLMLILFVLFPRIPGPLWGLSTTSTAKAGLDDRMNPGAIASLSQNDAVAFRVQFEDGVIPPQRDLYWRGPVLHAFDGRSWYRGFTPPIETTSFEAEGRPTRYTVTLEASQRHWMFALELPSQLPPSSELAYDFQLTSDHPIVSKKRYRVESYLDWRLPTGPTDYALLRDRQLPNAIINPQTRELGSTWAREHGGDAAAIMNRALSYYRQEGFVYTLQPGPLGASPMDDFLFDTQRGFCEHFASSFTLLMRSAGIPARVVTGYQGGEENPISGDLVVRQSSAHAWAEVWVEGTGWIRVDPTAAVAPDRIEQGLEASLPAGETLPTSIWGTGAWQIYLEAQWDAINSYWDEFVLGYGPELQQALLAWLGLGENTDWRHLTVLVVIVFGAAVAFLAWRLLRSLRRDRSDPVLVLYRKLQQRLVAAGVEPVPHEGPRDYAARAMSVLPGAADTIDRAMSLIIALRYQRDPDPADLDALRAAVRSLDPRTG